MLSTLYGRYRCIDGPNFSAQLSVKDLDHPYLTVSVLKVVEIRAHEARSGTGAKSRASEDGGVHGSSKNG